MLILNELLERWGGPDGLHRMGSVRLESQGRTLLVEVLPFGPTSEHCIRIVRCNRFGAVEPEIHLERRGEVWLPYYCAQPAAGLEVFLYHAVGMRELRVDRKAGACLLELSAALDLLLWAEGFGRAAEDAQYHALFAEGGAA